MPMAIQEAKESGEVVMSKDLVWGESHTWLSKCAYSAQRPKWDVSRINRGSTAGWNQRKTEFRVKEAVFNSLNFILKLPSTIAVSIWSLEHLFQNYPEFLLKCRFLGTLPNLENLNLWRWVLGKLGISIFNKISFAPSPRQLQCALKNQCNCNFCFYINYFLLLWYTARK